MGSTKTIRHALHTAVVALAGGNGVDTADIHRFRTARFSSNPTHIVISSHVTTGDEFTQSDIESGYFYLVQILARYSDLASEEAAEDAIDDIGDLLIEGLGSHDAGDAWDGLDFDQPRPNSSFRIGDSNYRLKTIIVQIKL